MRSIIGKDKLNNADNSKLLSKESLIDSEDSLFTLDENSKEIVHKVIGVCVHCGDPAHTFDGRERVSCFLSLILMRIEPLRINRNKLYRERGI